MPVAIFKNRGEASRLVARRIVELMELVKGRRFVLGLATGSTPVGVYRELVRLHQEEGLSFRNVVTFNLDEYYPLSAGHRESYRRFMREQLFDHVDIPEEQIHIPDGEVSRDQVFAHCREYEEAIAAAGGLDFQILGIGRTGHIGFNEPGSGRGCRTRLVSLNALTRRDAARDFLGEANVPRYGITMGVETILQAREIVMMGWGESKAGIIARAVEEPQSDQLPASYLQDHARVTVIVDEAAGSALRRRREPWRTQFMDWTDDLEHKAVTQLCGLSGKPVLKLIEGDYSENGLADLVAHRGPAYDINIKVFNRIQRTITGWPGGKPDADDTYRPERALPARKRVLVVGAEPGDEVNGMGGTLHRLIRHGHDVHVAILTSGDLSVSDDEAASFLELLSSLKEGEDLPLKVGLSGIESVMEELESKGPEAADSLGLRYLKGLIREGESSLSLRGLGLTSGSLHFLRLPYYTRGRYRQFVPTAADHSAVVKLLEKIQPHQIFASGSESDPATVSGVGFEVLSEALEATREATWFEDCRLWLYRGEGEEWETSEVDMAVPLSPDELQFKSAAIYRHRTQQGGGPVRKSVETDLWEQIEQLNRRTATLYDALGIAEYEAIECFKRGALSLAGLGNT